MNLPHEKTWKKLISVRGEGHTARFPILSKNFVTYTNFVHALVTKKDCAATTPLTSTFKANIGKLYIQYAYL